MSNVDELCIKYVFDELDPSEITLVEQAMIADQNLLIEIESLKSTWRRLKNLPEVSPPVNISDAIIHHARDYANQQQFFGNKWNNPGLMATAAIVVFSLLISTVYLLPDEHSISYTVEVEESTGSNADEKNPAVENNSNFNISESGLQTGMNFGFLEVLGERNGFLMSGTGQETGLMPDRETHKSADTLGTIIKAEPGVSVNRPLLLSPAFRDFQLTGSNY